MESKVFWYYIKTTSKPYSSSYYSLNGNYINNFGICRLSIYERKFVLEEQNKDLQMRSFSRNMELRIVSEMEK